MKAHGARAYEANFDGLIGPTHNYAGLSYGNVASESHGGQVSRPREAALQGLQKMKFLADLGIPQFILPPLPRPNLDWLARLGFSGDAAAMTAQAAKAAPRLLAQAYSASSMWAANAATVSASADTADGRVHFTPANLVSTLHRAMEPVDTARTLRAIFADERHFAHHAPLPGHAALGDEGAANFMRFCSAHGEEGLEVLVYGRSMESTEAPKKYPARQSREASEAVFRLHGVKRALTIQQNPAVIDQGVFHNDVIAVANETALLYHQEAFLDGEEAVDRMELGLGRPIERLRISTAEVPVLDAVKSYLFNSQLISLPEGGMAIVAPTESRDTSSVHAALQRIAAANDNPVTAVHYLDVRESMKNGGGPACLRLRVVLTEAELAAVHSGVRLTDALYERLGNYVSEHYRETLSPAEIGDPALAAEALSVRRGLLELLDLEELG